MCVNAYYWVCVYSNLIMSLFQYFKQHDTKETEPSGAYESIIDKHPECISEKEIICIQEDLKRCSKTKERVVYQEKDKQEIAKYAAMCGATPAVRKFKVKFPRLTESTIRSWVKKYKEMIKAKSQRESSRFVNFKICEKRGRPLLFDEELDHKLRAMVITLWKVGSVINVHVIRGILMGLICSNSPQFGQYCDFVITRSWVRSLYQRRNFHDEPLQRLDQ